MLQSNALAHKANVLAQTKYFAARKPFVVRKPLAACADWGLRMHRNAAAQDQPSLVGCSCTHYFVPLENWTVGHDRPLLSPCRGKTQIYLCDVVVLESFFDAHSYLYCFSLVAHCFGADTRTVDYATDMCKPTWSSRKPLHRAQRNDAGHLCAIVPFRSAANPSSNRTTAMKYTYVMNAGQSKHTTQIFKDWHICNDETNYI